MMWKFWIDTGGTFTDCLAESPEGDSKRVKVLSSSSVRGTVVEVLSGNRIRLQVALSCVDGFYVGYRLLCPSATRVAEAEIVGWDAAGCEAVVDVAVGVELGAVVTIQSPEEPPSFAMRIVMGLALKAEFPPIELKLATTRGTNALLESKGARVAFFVTRGFGDVLRIGNQQRPKLFELGIRKPDPLYAKVIEVDERLDAEGRVLKAIDVERLEKELLTCREEGVESVAIAFLHSYRNPVHEKALERYLNTFGFSFISLSSDLSPYAKIVPRAQTAVVDAYLGPIMHQYLDSVEKPLEAGSMKVMTSAGGLTSRSLYRPKDSLLSGPAGGVVGSSEVAKRAGFAKSIAFDMGGTSTDVSRYDGRLDLKSEQRIGAAQIFAPSLRIETVAAGGGSVCWYDGVALRVGPESAGAFPGPACYGAGGPLTLTDVNLLLGRLDAETFSIPVRVSEAKERLEELVSNVGGTVTGDALLKGFLEIANERMAEAIRGISVREGYDPEGYALVAFGGAGGLHACAIAEMLGIQSVLFPADSGLLSAYGLRRAVVESIAEKQILKPWDSCRTLLDTWIIDLAENSYLKLVEEGEERGSLEVISRQVELRFVGQESGFVLEVDEVSEVNEQFMDRYRERYGFVPEGLPLEVVSLRVSVARCRDDLEGEAFVVQGVDRCRGDVSIIERGDLLIGDRVEGPVVVQDRFSTVFVAGGWDAVVGDCLSLKLSPCVSSGDESSSDGSDVAALELYTNRFLSIVEEMGAVLERAAFSTNVKERKDFSCALLDREGELLANAPHIPVHLGALGVCLRTVLKKYSLAPGDVLVTNHPRYGGSHLPDVTLLAGVYSDCGDLVGYVANRAHHAEIGGICPGSMPPNARSLEEEGVVLDGIYLCRSGVVDWVEIRSVLTGAHYPTRRLEENIADLAAQLASIRKGVDGLRELCDHSGLERTLGFMNRLKNRSMIALQSVLERIEAGDVRAEEIMDNGACIRVCVKWNAGGVWVDFEGSSEVRNDNYNATPAIVTSALIYVLRLMVDEDIPLNEGLMELVELKIPEGSFLNPVFSEVSADCPPVVAGNVEVSQAVVTVLIRALGLAAGSQGTMNNLIFGNEKCSYYETIAGGEGATELSDGASGVHTHMTNTAMTDAEIFELRFPVRLEEFSICSGSGGNGLHRGGDGVLRRICFLEAVELSLLTQHRQSGPLGMSGGSDGDPGKQCLIRINGEVEHLGSDVSIQVGVDTVIEVSTPSGGGWGEALKED